MIPPTLGDLVNALGSEQRDALWVWKDEDQVMYYDTHEMARVQVIAEDWHDQTPTGPIGIGDVNEHLDMAPYKITGSMKGSGLGCCLWWDE